MRHLKSLALALCALFVLAAVASATASAETLPVVTPNVTGTGTGGVGTFFIEGGGLKGKSSKITFEKATKKAEGGQENLGLFTIDFEGVVGTTLEEPCNSLGDAAGIVLVKGEYHWVVLPNGNLGLLLLVAKEDNGEDIHVECTSEGLLYLIWGSILAQVDKTTGVALKVGEKVKEVLILVNAPSGKQEFTEYINNKAEKVAAGLKGKIGTGIERSAAEESKNNKLTLSAEAEVTRK